MLRNRNNRIGSGFTLIELLVVVSIIALLVGILLPSLGKARRSAKAITCASQLKGLGTGVMTYLADEKDWIPGYNTSGVGLRSYLFRLSSNPDLLRNPYLPVQPHDWITPVLSQEMELPANRAQRMREGTERYKCPSQLDIQSTLYNVNDAPDSDDFLAEDEWTTLSYLMPMWFQFWGQEEKGKKLAPMYGMQSRWVTAAGAPAGDGDTWEVVVDSYVSRINRVGTPAIKILASDGTRYLDSTQILDHDIAPLPSHFGSYATSGAWWSGSTAFGVKNGTLNWDQDEVSVGSAGDGLNLRLTYRHNSIRERSNGTCQTNKGMINAVFFDGHVDRLTDRESRKIEYWYPRGGVVAHPQGMTTVPQNYVIR